MKLSACLTLLLVVCFLTACGTPAVVVSRPEVILAPADATATPTPFQPLAPTPTYLPTGFPAANVTPVSTPLSTTQASQYTAKTWSDYPGPLIWPDVDIPEPVGLLAQPPGQVNILLLGSDQRPNDGGFRTDTIQLLSINPRDHTVSITSFPRDLYVYIPGYTVQRINTAFGWGEFDALAQTFEYNFGVRPEHYVLINFWSFRDIIDNLGGVDVVVAHSLTDHRDGYGYYTVPAGVVHMDGETALWYVRARYTTSDFDRGPRQQEVLEAIFKKLISLDAVSRAPQLYEIYKANVVTDLTFEDIAPLVPLATEFANDPGRMRRYSIGPDQVWGWINSGGANVQLPNRDAVLGVIREAITSP